MKKQEVAGFLALLLLFTAVFSPLTVLGNEIGGDSLTNSDRVALGYSSELPPPSSDAIAPLGTGDSTILLDFEEDNLGTFPKDFTFKSGKDKSKVKVVAEPNNSSNKVLELLHSGGERNMASYKLPAPVIDFGTYEFRLYVDTQATWFQVMLQSDTGDVAITVSANATNYIHYPGDSTYSSPLGGKFNEWVDFKVVLDVTAQRYDIYVNDEKIVTSGVFEKPVTTLSQLVLSNGTGATPKYFIDDIVIHYNATEDTLLSVETLADLEVVAGTAFDSLSLPSTVLGYTTNIPSGISLPVVWDSATYDPALTIAQTIEGTLQIPDNISSSFTKVSIKITIPLSGGSYKIFNFEEDVLGAFPIGWDFWQGATKNAVQVAKDPKDSANKALRLTPSSGTRNIVAYTFDTAETIKGTYEFRMYVDTLAEWGGFTVLGKNKEVIARVYTHTSKYYVHYPSGDSSQKIPDVAFNEWVDFKVEVDLATSTYNIFGNGAALVTDAPFEKASTTISSVSFTNGGGTNATFYVDDVIMKGNDFVYTDVVTGFETLKDVSVALGTDFSSIPLPNTVLVFTENSPEGTAFPVTWTKGDYDATKLLGSWLTVGCKFLQTTVMFPKIYQFMWRWKWKLKNQWLFI